MSNYSDIWYQSADGLKLYARDYNNCSAQTTVLCMHGLNRNSADFESLCDHLQKKYRVIAVDQRGRGLSQWDPDPSHYRPMVYVRDMWTLLDLLDQEQVALIGTSMGGLMAMLMMAEKPHRILGMAINDIGPELDPTGLERIRKHIGKLPIVNNWDDAVAHCKRNNGFVFPDYDENKWQQFARRLYSKDENGVPVLRHDPAIAVRFESDNEVTEPSPLWDCFDLSRDKPILVIRGETSDLLAVSCVKEMQHRKPDLHYVEVAKYGHAPMLDEPEAVAAIDAFLISTQYRLN